MATPLRVLIVEDRPIDAELMQAELRRAGFTPLAEIVDDEAGYRARLRPDLDVILSDFSLPLFNGLVALEILKESGLDVPFIIVTGSISEEVAVQCMRGGAADYLLKDRLGRLGQAVARAIQDRRHAGERRRAEAALRESEERFRGVLNSAAEAIISIDDSQRIVLFNVSAERIFGYTAAEILGQPLDLLIPEPLAGAHREHVRAFVASGETARPMVLRRHDLHGRRKDGSEVPIEASISRHTHEGRTVLTAILQDITERRRAEDEILRQREALLQRDKVATMGSLLAGVAHELNNPLAILVGQTDLLIEMVEDPEIMERAEKIHAAAERCARIVRNFLALARQRPPERQAVDLNQVVREAMDLLAYPLRVNDIQVTFALAPGLPEIHADRHQLHQVVVNLVSNAQQAMSETPPPRQLTLTTRTVAEGGAVRLDITDSGPGIAAEVRARIFEPFFTTKPAGQGTGLGLSLCQSIITSHGGAISASSTPGLGAVFTIELPAAMAPPVAPRAAPVASQLPGRRVRVLVVDDEEGVARVLQQMLGADGHDVDVALGGAAALERLDTRVYDVILCDLRMPGLDGLQLYRELERRDASALRRLVLCTGDVLGHEAQEFLETVAAPTLSKPFVAAEVRRVVRKVAESAG